MKKCRPKNYRGAGGSVAQAPVDGCGGCGTVYHNWMGNAFPHERHAVSANCEPQRGQTPPVSNVFQR